MQAAHRRHDISDKVWAKLEPLLPGQRGMWGGIARDNRLFINAVCWILRTGAPWRDLPPDGDDWKNSQRHYKRWADTGVWERLRRQSARDPELTWLMIDARYVKAHRHATGAQGGSQDIAMTKGGGTPRYPLRLTPQGCRYELTAGTVHDGVMAQFLTEDSEAQGLIAGRSYDTNALIPMAERRHKRVVILPRKNRLEQRSYDWEVYRRRYLGEYAFRILRRCAV